MQIGKREILVTTTCMYNHKTHWHASIVKKIPGGDSSIGKGWCLTTPAALLWVITGFHRKTWVQY